MNTLNDTSVVENDITSRENDIQPAENESQPTISSVGGRRRRRILQKSRRGKNKFSKKYNKKSCKKSRRSYKMFRSKKNILGW